MLRQGQRRGGHGGTRECRRGLLALPSVLQMSRVRPERPGPTHEAQQGASPSAGSQGRAECWRCPGADDSAVLTHMDSAEDHSTRPQHGDPPGPLQTAQPVSPPPAAHAVSSAH